jgi:hypothetical protein
MWKCNKFKNVIDPIAQRNGCDYHVFIPSLVPLTVVDADPDVDTVTYEGDIVNGYGATLSRNLQEKIP